MHGEPYWEGDGLCPPSAQIFGVLGVNCRALRRRTLRPALPSGRVVRCAHAVPLRPVIAANFPLDRDADAMRHLQDRRAIGKIVAMI